MPNRSPSPSSSSQESATPPPLVVEKKSKKKSNGKEKSKPKPSAEEAKYEGANLNWDYAPPDGVQLIEEHEDADAGDFDWDEIKKNDDLELWLIRVPESVKPKHLDGLSIDLPTSSKSARVGELKRKHTNFDIWSVGDDADNLPIGGEEIKGLSCLLPRSSKKGKLYPSPKPISHHLVVSAQAVAPTPAADSNASTSTQYKNPPRPTYPQEVLKHRFIPFGSVIKNVDENAEDAVMDVDHIEEPQPGQPPSSPKKKSRSKKTDEEAAVVDESEPEVKVKKTKGKKRKGEPGEPGDTPAKKAKKAKVA
ncbi:hypothetical protein GALMADRAFT_264280 [Galerina marginata CBS 339.88]|uniref:Uncharacterized protein n=1 Tax=Galerina marginata (strain CBS 339.88) TaxID=685588 RepID=A0A067TI52_GALM3|nr:hypothetical protein GALMADRAFT_264280 [Galerina marginata CBS 339.88]